MNDATEPLTAASSVKLSTGLQQTPNMNAHEQATAVPPLRLLDRDPSKFRSLKRVIVMGSPGSGLDGKCRMILQCLLR